MGRVGLGGHIVLVIHSCPDRQYAAVPDFMGRKAVIDEPYNSATTVESVCTLMATPPAWARGLPLDANGYECVFYMKN